MTNITIPRTDITLNEIRETLGEGVDRERIENYLSEQLNPDFWHIDALDRCKMIEWCFERLNP